MSATDWQITIRCSCGYTARVSSPLGAFMSGWRYIDFPARIALCFRCEREHRLLQMEAPHEPG
jgi:hypothetical protein